MNAVSIDELVRRISKLAKQNQELEELVKKLQKENEKLFRENEKQKALLERMPVPGSEGELQAEQRDRSLKFDMATVLFADIHGFSQLIQGMDSSAIMDELDEILYEFDQIAARYKIEKIRTIGDTYMLAGGIPVKNITNPIDVVMAALEIGHFSGSFRLNGVVRAARSGI